MDLKKERDLEKKYTDVLIHHTIGGALKGYKLSSRSVGAAIKAYCKAEKTSVPDNFCDNEVFANNVFDYWEESKPGYHADLEYEKTLEGIKRYLAFKFIWKKKVQSNTTITPTLQLQAANMLTVKSALGAAVISAHSHSKSDPRLRPGELAETMEIAFQSFLPIIHKLQTDGELDNGKVKYIAEKIRGYIDSEEFKQIEYKKPEGK